MLIFNPSLVIETLFAMARHPYDSSFGLGVAVRNQPVTTTLPVLPPSGITASKFHSEHLGILTSAQPSLAHFFSS